jgi:hypothetical protein
MNTLEALLGCNSGTIDHNVSNLAQKDVSRGPSRCSILITVGTRVDESKSFKVRSGLEDGAVARVADELGHVVEDDGLANQVCTRGNVHNGGRVSRRLADPRTAAVAIGNGTIDGIRIISDAITYIKLARFFTKRTILLTDSPILADVAKDLIAIWIGVESSEAFAGHVVEPVAIRKSSRSPDARVLLGGDAGWGVDVSRNVT